MSLFVHNEEDGAYEAVIKGIRFTCEEVSAELEAASAALADAYKEKLPQIADFMLGDIVEVFGDMSADALISALGTPEIDLDRSAISYFNQALDDSHIIEVEYGGVFDELYEVIIDG